VAIFHTDSYPGPPWYQINGHWQTILPALRGPKVGFHRERLELDDGDFLDLDWLQNKGSRSLVILTHGLEGNSRRPYMRSAARYFHALGWDALAWNCRSCSGEMNRLFRFYHHGEIEDIHRITTYALQQKDYQEVVLIGYSMGGAMTTKYLSVHSPDLPEVIRGGIAFSSPFDLEASVDALELPGNELYKTRFMKQLGEKFRIKDQRFPGKLDMAKLEEIETWKQFDEWFTAPILGVASAQEFYDLASAKNFLPTLKRPVLAVSALNDPIITEACLPLEEAKDHPYLTLELTPDGGHVGFSLRRNKHSWMEERAWQEILKWREN
jgi:hypothetical protein